MGPATITLSASVINWQLASSRIFGFATALSPCQSTWSSVLTSGKRASRSSRARGALPTAGDFGFEQLGRNSS